MIVKDFKYYNGDCSETIELDVVGRNGMYITTCVVNVNLLLCGVAVFPCGNGDDLKLDQEQRLKVLEFALEERTKIANRYPVKTYEGWQKSGLPTFEDYCFPGDEVDDTIVQHFVNSVPPILMLSSCTQGGEVYSHEADDCGAYRPTYITFHISGGHWTFDGYCFYGENKNRVSKPSKLEQIIEAARREPEPLRRINT